MGSWISSSCESVHNFVDDKIFCPPTKPTQKDIDQVTTNRSKIYYVIDGTTTTSYIHIQPTRKITNKFIVFSHGNGCDMFGMYSYLVAVANGYGCNVICYDYAGYGLSVDETNRCSEQGCYNALKYVIDDISHKFNLTLDNILLVGQSLGTGVVVDYVAKQRLWISPIMLISPYKTIARVIYDSSFVGPIDKFLTKNKIGKLTCPVKIFHGKADKLILIEHGMELYTLLKNKSLDPVWIENADHNNILEYVTYDDIF